MGYSNVFYDFDQNIKYAVLLKQRVRVQTKLDLYC